MLPRETDEPRRDGVPGLIQRVRHGHEGTGDRLDFRVDLFALGVMLYEMVSGRHPFEASTYAATVDRILRVDPPPLATPDHEPSRLEPVVTRCLAKDPAQRYASTPALVAHLEQVHATSGGYAPVVASARHASSGARATRHLHARWWWVFHQIAISAVYVLACAAIMLDLLVVRPEFTWPGLVLVLTGIPVYFLWRWLHPVPRPVS